MKLLETYPDKLEDFFFIGIPEKIIQSYHKEWPLEIRKKVIEILSKVAIIDNVKDLIAKGFLEELLLLIKEDFDNRKIVKYGTKLLSICSDNITSV